MMSPRFSWILVVAGFPAALAQEPATLPSPDIGICALLQAGASRDVMEKRLAAFKSSGVTAVRTGFVWRNIEPARGKYDFERQDVMVKVARENGIRLLGLISHTPQWAAPIHEHFEEWLAFVDTTVRRYPSVRHWEMFNEPNMASFWGSTPDPVRAAELVRLTHRKIKSTDPSLTVVFPGLAGGNNATPGYPRFLEAMFENGVAGHYDAMSIHPYRFPHSPEEGRYARNAKFPEKWPLTRTLSKIRELMQKHGDGDKPLWITEYGYTTHSGEQNPNLGVTESEQADFLSRSYLLAFQSGVSSLFWFTTQTAEKAPENKEHWFGIIHPDYTPRPAFLALTALRRAYPAGSVLARERFQSDPVYRVSWRRPDAKTAWALWSAERESTKRCDVRIAGAIQESFDGVGRAAPVKIVEGTATVELKARVLYLVGPGTVEIGRCTK